MNEHRAGTERRGVESFRRQRWTGWLALVVGAPLGVVLVAGGMADGAPAVLGAGLVLLVIAAFGTRIVRGAVVLELDDAGFVDHRSGVRLTWDEVERIRPRVRWRRFQRLRFVDVDVTDPADVRDLITNRAGRFIVRRMPGGGAGQPSLGLNVISADANEVLEAFERWSGRHIPERFTLIGVRSARGD